jgi:zinc transport system substrate-binding protein
MKPKSKIAAIALIASVTLLGSSCSRTPAVQSSSQSSEKPTVAVSIVPEATFAKAVCGNLADIVTAIPPGSSPETYEPTPKEMTSLSRAQIYFAIGVPAESAGILPKVSDIKTMKVVKLQDEVAKVYTDRKFESGGRDPHIWLSPKRVKVMVKVMAQELEAIDPSHSSQYQKNEQAYEKKMDTLDTKIQTILSGVKSRTFIVFHPAFGYFADDYGLKMTALEQDGKEATAQRMQQIVDLAKADGTKTVFYQEEIDSKQAKALAEEIGGKTTALAPLAADYENNLIKMAQTIARSVKNNPGGK